MSFSFNSNNSSKRGRGDDVDDEGSTAAGSFAKAPASALTNRRMVKATTEKRGEFARHIEKLNAQFAEWVNRTLADPQNRQLLLVEGAQDYLAHLQQLRERYLRSYGVVLTFGSGDCGQLAHGVEEDSDLMVRFPRVVASLAQLKVTMVACGGLHNAVVTADGAVYTWGCADDGSLGRTGDENEPGRVGGALDGRTVLGVACGDTQTICYTTEGEVYGWGCFRDKEGKKFFTPTPGHADPASDVRKQQDTPLLVEGFGGPAGKDRGKGRRGGACIVEVACGSCYSMARAEDGSVYSWGLGEQGNLGRRRSTSYHHTAGRGGSSSSSSSSDVDALPPLRDPKTDSYVLTDIFAYHVSPGLMYLQQKGGGSAAVPVRGAKTIGCGAYHSMVVAVIDDREMLYCCGLNNYGQLGIGGRDEVPLLTAVENVQREGMTEAAAGGFGGSILSVCGGVHHSVALVRGQHRSAASSTVRNVVYAWGRSDSGQLGMGRSVGAGAGDSCDIPRPVDMDAVMGTGETVVQVSCGGNHNLALTSTAHSNAAGPTRTCVYSWGYGDMLALGHGKEADEVAPRKVTPPASAGVSFGSGAAGDMTVTQVCGGGQHSAIIGRVTSLK